MAKLAVIPSRGGSKRIPRKNIKLFSGKPIIAYSIQAALNSNLFDEVMVSTDDSEIQSIAEKYGATVPFIRSQENSNDKASLTDVLVEVLDCYQKKGQSFESSCCLLATAPFVSAEILIESYRTFKLNGVDSLVPSVEYSYPIQRAFEIKDNLLKMVWPEHLFTRSQDLEPRYHDAGMFYWINTKAFLKQNSILMGNTGAYILSNLVAQDIDTEDDWKLAELKMEFFNRKK